ncbi:MAG: hypothetical protein ACI81V_000132 [Lentimonas sp.]|jgi:hypothetical protein
MLQQNRSIQLDPARNRSKQMAQQLPLVEHQPAAAYPTIYFDGIDCP